MYRMAIAAPSSTEPAILSKEAWVALRNVHWALK
jgi:hypothetical protein